MKRAAKTPIVILLLVLFIGLALLGSCHHQDQEGAAKKASQGRLTIGGKGYTEQILLLKILAVYLKEHGYDVVEVPNMASNVARTALENGQIDLYWEYTGTALVMYLQQPAQADPASAYETVRQMDLAHDLVWLDKTELNSSYVILMQSARAQQLGIASISDLAEVVNRGENRLLFASSSEFASRDDGLQGLERHYRFKFPRSNLSRLDTGLLYSTLKDGQVDVVAGIATDGRIERFDLVALRDDRSFFPAYNAAPVVRKELLDSDPRLAELINRIPGLLDNRTMRTLTALVDVEHEDVIEVVRNWLSRHRLIETQEGAVGLPYGSVIE